MNIIALGKRLIVADQIALVEPFDPAANPELKSERDFKARLVPLNRDTVLMEMAPQEFAEVCLDEKGASWAYGVAGTDLCVGRYTTATVMGSPRTAVDTGESNNLLGVCTDNLNAGVAVMKSA